MVRNFSHFRELASDDTDSVGDDGDLLGIAKLFQISKQGLILLELLIIDIDVVFWGQLASIAGILDRGLLTLGSDPSSLPGFHEVTLAALESGLHVCFEFRHLLLKITHIGQVVDVIGVFNVCCRYSCWKLTCLGGRRSSLRLSSWLLCRSLRSLLLRLSLLFGLGNILSLRPSLCNWLCYLSWLSRCLLLSLNTSGLCGRLRTGCLGCSDLFQCLEWRKDLAYLEFLSWYFLVFLSSCRLMDHQMDSQAGALELNISVQN